MSQPGMYRFPSMTSVHSMVSMGHLPPGHGYVPRKQKPDKPYGPNFVTIMNRTWRGPGARYLIYSLICFCVALVFYSSAALYFGHRNVSRMIVLRTEVFGAIFIIIAILFTGLTFHYLYKANEASNKWRGFTKFRAEGLYTAAAYNHAYLPEDGMKLATGTYGPRALKEIPRPKAKGRSRRGSQSSGRGVPPPTTTANTGGRRYEKKSEAALPQPPPPKVADLNPNDTLEDLYYLGQPPPPPVTTSQGHDWPQGYQPHSQSSGLGYQPPPQDPAHLYAKPTRRPRPPKNQQAASTSVPILSPMPASPSAYAAPIYSMEDVHGSMGRISLQGARVSESEL